MTTSSPPGISPFLFANLLLCALIPAHLSGQEAFSKAPAVDAAVAAEMKSQRIVGAAIGIISDSRIVYAKGYGFANIERRMPVTTDTVFNWASNSKPVMGIAAMQLVQDGKLDIDKPIGAYIRQLPNHLRPITTRQLLCHQSGIPHYTNGKIVPSGGGLSVRDERDPAKSMQRFLMSPLIFEPGDRTSYSSYAYVLLSAVVQVAGAEPIDRQLSTRITGPLGMGSFQLDLPLEGQDNWTTAYRYVGTGPRAVPDYAHFWKHGAGGYKSNVRDFARFALAIEKFELIDEKTSLRMWTPQKLNNGSTSSYGLGLVVSGSGRGLKVSHNGSQDETRTRMVIYPNQNHGVVVMCNTRDCDPGKISTAIYTAMRDER